MKLEVHDKTNTPIDSATMTSLASLLGDADLMRDSYFEFYKMIRRIREDLSTFHFNNPDFAATQILLLAILHQLRGSARQFGANFIAEKSQSLEQNIALVDRYLLPDKIEEITRLLDDCLSFLIQHFNF